MINVLQRLAELDAGNSGATASLVETPVIAMTGDGMEPLNINMPEPDLSALRALSGVKNKDTVTESAVSECGVMGGMTSPTMPTTINMSAPGAAELVGLIRGIMDLAGKDEASTAMDMPPANVDQLIGHHEPLVAEPEHDAAIHAFDQDGEKPVSGPTFGDEAGDDTGSDELAQMMKMLKTGQPVKIKTDMPVKVSTDEPVKGTTDKTAKVSDDEDESYDNTPDPKSKGYNPNDFAQVVNKVRDFDYTPPGSASNPIPDEEKKEESTDSLSAFEAQLFADYKEFVSEGSTGDYSAKKGAAGKDLGKPGKNFAKIAKSAGEKYGNKASGMKVAGAVLSKLRKG